MKILIKIPKKKLLISILLILCVVLISVFMAFCGDDEATDPSDTTTTTSESSSNASSDVPHPTDSPSSLSSVTSDYLESIEPNEDAKKAVTTAMNSIINGSLDKAQKLILPKVGFEPDPDLGFDETTMKRVKKILSKIEYTIVYSESVDDTHANVRIKISALDFKGVFTSYMENAEKLLQSGPMTDEEHNKKLVSIFAECLKKGKTVESELIVQVVKTDKKWKIQDTPTFSSALLGGIYSVGQVFYQ